MAKKKKVRVDLRKNRSKPPRQQNWTRGFQEHGLDQEATAGSERVRAKGDLSRRRTIVQDEGPGASPAGADSTAMPAADASTCLAGRVLRVHGLASVVETEDGRQYRCAVRRLLKSLATDERNVVTTGDLVWFRSAANDEGMIETVEPRHGVLTRSSRKREHVEDRVVRLGMAIQDEQSRHHGQRSEQDAKLEGDWEERRPTVERPSADVDR